MLEIKVDTSRLEAAMLDFCNASRKGMESVIKKTGGTMVGQLIGVTPPGNQKTLSGENGGITLQAKKMGEANVSSDIKKLFPTTKKKDSDVFGMIDAGYKWRAQNERRYQVAEFAQSVADLKRIHKSAKNPKTGRTRIHGGQNMAVTRSQIRSAYIKSEVKKVGMLAAGWLNAASELNTPSRYIPGWIKRHGAGRGGVEMRKNSGSYSLRIYNNNPWIGIGWEARLKYVVSRGTAALKVATEKELDKRAKAAEQRMGR